MNLFERIENIKRDVPEAYKPLPDYIPNNLKVDEVREYQEEAFRNFITYFENENMRQKPSKTLFWVSTGGGKTLIMAGLMLYLYEKGYRDFIFFVNNTNIIKKTINNFTDPNNEKYLFKDKISINGEYIEIKKVNTFDESDPNAINIMFTSIQGLHADMSIAKENRMSLESFENKKIVLLADEAHHNLTATRRKGKNNNQNEEASWENTVNAVYKCNSNNVLLEFTATYDMYNEDIVEEYKDKIIYEYDLKHFRKDGYSKEIEVVRTDLDLEEKMIVAMVFSQYRLKVFQKNGIIAKPCILFKAHKEIKECEKNIEQFKELVKNLTGKRIKDVCESLQEDDKKKVDVVEDKTLKNKITIKRAIEFFHNNGIDYNDLAIELKDAFSDEHIISANDNDVEKNQLALNSLEDENNPYRAIFEVRKLDEGWDVLNLFDIVRMYTSREGGTTEVQPATMSEAQLIGRGARYFPFKIKEDDPLYQRKYDEDLQNELRVCETLLYHCQTDSKYIAEIKKALIQTGAIDNEKHICTYKLKEEFKNEKLYQNGFILVNDRKEKSDWDINGISPTVRDIEYNIYTNTGLIGVDAIFEEESTNIDNNNLKEKRISIKEIAEINYSTVRKALMQYMPLQFDNLKKKFPNLKSTKEFITSNNYMGDMRITIHSMYDEPNIDILYKAVKKICDELAKYVSGIGKIYEGTSTFKPIRIDQIFTDKEVQYSMIVDNGKGQPQKESSDENIRLDLSKEDWYAYNENYGTNEEKEFIAYIKKRVDELKNKYDKIYVVRNERQMHLYSFDDGLRFEPDYVLFLIKNNGEGYEQLQVFIEPKGDQLLEQDDWKEKFLLQIREFGVNGAKLDFKILDDNDYIIWGVHFFNKNNRLDEFKKDINELINIADKY